MNRLLKASLFVCLIAVSTSAGFAKGRSFEECQKLAVARGVPIGHAHPNRYQMLKNAGAQHTHPTGFMAQCMSGMPMH